MCDLGDDPLPAPDDLGRVHPEAAVRERRLRSRAAGHAARRLAHRVALALATPLQLTQAIVDHLDRSSC